MSSLRSRASIAAAVVAVALLWSGPADAQVGVDPGPPRQPGGLLQRVVTGAEYDILNQAMAEHRLQKLQQRLRRDTERGDKAASERDLRQINHTQYRITIDEWLIRWNMRQYPDFYPILTDSVSCVAIAQSTYPTQVPNPQRRLTIPGAIATAPTITITIANAEPSGAGIDFAIDGITHHAAPGSRQDLNVATNAFITYDSGGSLGQRQYVVSPGRFEFRSTAEGWALYKLSGAP